MIDGKEIIISALRDFGVEATVNGMPLVVIPSLDSKEQLDADGLVIRTGPYVEASADDVFALNPVVGNDGDTITINGADYTMLAIDPDGSGMVTLSLEEVV